jgi:membrane-bound serine protease (ClpP class)
MKARRGAWRHRIGFLGLSCALAVAAARFAAAQDEPPASPPPASPGDRKATVDRFVLVAPIEGMIDLGLVPFVERVIQTAESEGAAAVILEVNTFGGRVDAAVAIRDLLLRSPVPTVVFVNKRAISAGALITLAAEKVVVASGATIGAATPVQMGGDGQSAPVQEKTVSYVRKEFRATADARGRPGNVAEAMVDADVEIEGLVEKGKLLTLTTEDALRHKVADHQADDLIALLPLVGLEGATIRAAGVNWAERVVRFLTHPVVSSLLITLAMLGLVVELRTPGFGVAGLIGLFCLAAFFWGHWIVRLVGWEEVLLVTGGVLLLALEIFVIPGFGIAGVIGGLAILAGLTSSLFGTGATLRTVIYAASRVAISGAVALGASLVLLRFLPLLPAGRKLVLSTALPAGGSVGHAGAAVTLQGEVGVALTSLRPAGIAEIGRRRVDVVTSGEYIEAGQYVKVIEEAGSRVVVEAYDRGPGEGGAG